MDQLTVRRLSQSAFFLALAIFIAAIIAMIWQPQIGDVRVIKTVLVLDVILIMTSILFIARSRMNMDPAEKSKRGLEGLDLYTVIDRLVTEVDDDEAAYLQKRLDERDANAKNDLTATLGDLLDQRAEVRRTNEQ